MSPTAIRTHAIPECPLCGAAGEALYERLIDRIFSAPGSWRMARCPRPDCGLLWLDPAPVAEELPRIYAGYYTHRPMGARGDLATRIRRWIREGHAADRYGTRVRAAPIKRFLSVAGGAIRPGLREGLDQLMMHLEPRRGGRLLDVGCGEGRSLGALRELGWTVEGVDFDPAAVEVARARGLNVRVGGLADQAYRERSFDAITMSHLIEHVPDPVALLREARRILSPGGRLVVLTPNASSLGHRRHGRDWRGLEPPRHLQVFGPTSLARAADQAGFPPGTLRSLATGARFFELERRKVASKGRESIADRGAADAFAREERRALATDPWAGEELLMMTTVE